MIDLQNMSFEELQKLKTDIADIENTKTRTYEVSYKVTFRANRTDDIADPESFLDHVYDDLQAVWNFKLPEGVKDVVVKEI